MSTPISKVGSFRRRYLSEFLGQNLLLMACTFQEKDREGKPIAKPFYELKLCVNTTGEMVDLIDSHTYIMGMCKKILEAVESGEAEYPIEFRVETRQNNKGQTVYEVYPWAADEVEERD